MHLKHQEWEELCLVDDLLGCLCPDIYFPSVSGLREICGGRQHLKA